MPDARDEALLTVVRKQASKQPGGRIAGGCRLQVAGGFCRQLCRRLCRWLQLRNKPTQASLVSATGETGWARDEMGDGGENKSINPASRAEES